jgi:hypothetical protein
MNSPIISQEDAKSKYVKEEDTKPKDPKEESANPKSVDTHNFVDITDLGIKLSKTDTEFVKIFNPQMVIQGLENFSYGVLDARFMAQIDHQHVFFAGGSLLSCFTKISYHWSDIDLWVNGDSESEILSNTIQLLVLLEESFRNKGYDKLIWSCMNNVITCYCVGYSRNIQIIMVKGSAEKNIDEFDFDYVKVFMKNNKIYGTLEFVDSFIEKQISHTYMTDKIKDSRLLKALIKGYKVTDELMKNEKIANIVNQYNQMYDANKQTKPNSQFINTLSKIRNKYYYPTELEYVEFINRRVPYYESRVYYMINQMCGHNDIHSDLDGIVAMLVEKRTNKINFTTQYAVHYSGNNISDIVPKKDHENKNILVDPENTDKNGGLCIQNRTFIHPESKRIKIPIRVFNNNHCVIFTGPLTINSRFLWNYSAYNVGSRIEDKYKKFALVRSCKYPNTDTNIDKIFDQFRIIDGSLMKFFNKIDKTNPLIIYDDKTKKDINIEKAEYQTLVRSNSHNMYYNHEPKEPTWENIKFHLMFSYDGKLETTIWKNKEALPLKITNINEIGKILSYNTRVELACILSHLSGSKEILKPRTCGQTQIYPKLNVLQIRIIE